MPGSIPVYEFRNHACVNGTLDVLRLNTYLSMDGDFVCIWHGLLDPMLTEGQFQLPEELAGFDFAGAYTIDLFRGRLASNDVAHHVLKSLEIEHAKYAPQVLAGAPDMIRCERLTGE